MNLLETQLQHIFLIYIHSDNKLPSIKRLELIKEEISLNVEGFIKEDTLTLTHCWLNERPEEHVPSQEQKTWVVVWQTPPDHLAGLKIGRIQQKWHNSWNHVSCLRARI